MYPEIEYLFPGNFLSPAFQISPTRIKCVSFFLSATFNTVKSNAVFEEAKTLMPGGVSSPVRAFRSVGGNPIVFDRVKGAYCWDVDGNRPWEPLNFS